MNDRADLLPNDDDASPAPDAQRLDLWRSLTSVQRAALVSLAQAHYSARLSCLRKMLARASEGKWVHWPELDDLVRDNEGYCTIRYAITVTLREHGLGAHRGRFGVTHEGLAVIDAVLARDGWVGLRDAQDRVDAAPDFEARWKLRQTVFQADCSWVKDARWLRIVTIPRVARLTDVKAADFVDTLKSVERIRAECAEHMLMAMAERAKAEQAKAEADAKAEIERAKVRARHAEWRELVKSWTSGPIPEGSVVEVAGQRLCVKELVNAFAGIIEEKLGG